MMKKNRVEKEKGSQVVGSLGVHRMAWEHFIEKVPWTSILKKVTKKTMEQLGRRFFR